MLHQRKSNLGEDTGPVGVADILEIGESLEAGALRELAEEAVANT